MGNGNKGTDAERNKMCLSTHISSVKQNSHMLASALPKAKWDGYCPIVRFFFFGSGIML